MLWLTLPDHYPLGEWLKEMKQKAEKVRLDAAANQAAIDAERQKHEARLAKYGPGVEPWH